MAKEDQVYTDLGRNLETMRNERGFTQTQIARAIHIPQSTYAGYEAGLRRMPLDVLKRLAGFFCVSVDELLKEESL